MTFATFDNDSNEPTFGDYFALLKPRVMSLVVFTALVGLVVAPVPLHPVEALASILFIALGQALRARSTCGGTPTSTLSCSAPSSAPFRRGGSRRARRWALGLGLSALSVMMLALAANLAAATLLAFTIFFYAVVYSMWLKRSTPQNIVIGGAAGAFPPMIGWVAATGGISVEAVLMFALIFMWTPPHFWALALFMKTDYHDARVPMLTVTHGPRATRNHILAYAVALAPVPIWLALTPVGGPLTLAVAVVANIWFVAGALKVWRRDTARAEADGFRAEKGFVSFLASVSHTAFRCVAG